MKKLRTTLNYALYILVVIGAFTSCTKGHKLKNTNNFVKFDVIEIDGCEYIQYGVPHGYLEITHKGDCKNAIHACN